MKIGFDAKRAFHNQTGLGNYSRFILTALFKQESNHSFYLYSPKVPVDHQEFLAPFPDVHLRQNKSALPNFAWRSIMLERELKRDGIDIFHGLSNELPVFGLHKKLKRVVTVHDLIFLRYPELYPFIDREIYKAKFKMAIERADKIIAISTQTKNDIIEFFKVKESKIDVVFQDCDMHFKIIKNQEEKDAVKIKYKLPERFILSVGTIEKRKNQLALVKAFHELNEDIHLVLIGKRTSYFNEIKSYIDSNKIPGIHFPENIEFTDLPAIYQSAEIFVYPSLFEGFGIPIIEAMHSHVPVITSTGSCFSETAGDAALFCHPEDPGLMTENMRELINNEALKSSLKAKGIEQVKKFSENKIAAELLNLYQKL